MQISSLRHPLLCYRRGSINAKADETALPDRPGCAILQGMEERIIRLETLAAMQDETISRLSEELFRQQQDAARLQSRIDALERRIAELAEPDPVGGNDRPPHY
jgi:uncharacterized coiled-coil protein SlyX